MRRTCINTPVTLTLARQPDGRHIRALSGFRYYGKSDNVDVPLMHETRNEYLNVMAIEDWNEQFT